MEFLIVVLIPVVAVWSAVLVRRQRAQAWTPSFALGGMAVIILGTVFGYDFFHASLGPLPVTLDRLLLVGLWAAFLICVLHGRETLRMWDRTDLIVLIFLALITFSTFTHDYQFRDGLPLSRLLFFNLLPVMLYLLVKSCRLTMRDLKWLIVGMIGLGVYLAATAIAEWQQWTFLVFPSYIINSDFEEFLGRGRGPLLNPISNGLLITTAIVATLIAWNYLDQRKRVFLLLLLALFAGGIAATLTRSVWLGAMLACVPFIWCHTDLRQKGVLAMLCSLGTIVLLSGNAERLFASFKRDRHVTVEQMAESAQLRPIFAEVAVRMVQDRPLWGCGFGQYTQYKIPYLDSPDTFRELAKAKPYMQHNVILAYLTELGLIGTGWLLLLFGDLFYVGCQLYRSRYQRPLARDFGLLLVALLIAVVTNAMFHDITIMPMANMLMFFVAGVASNLYRQEQVENVRGRLKQRDNLDVADRGNFGQDLDQIRAA